MKNRKLEARRIVAKRTSHKLNNRQAKALGKISSIGTERNFRQSIKNYLDWCEKNNIHPDSRANISNLKTFLGERSEWVQQKTLNQERQALQLIFRQKIPFVFSLQETILDKRSYLLSEILQIVNHQHEKNSITTWISYFSGIRAHEAATILPKSEQAPSFHRTWDERRFIGLQSYQIYTVVGKGGLTREVAIPNWLAKILEAKRRPEPIIVLDREIRYTSYYDIGFGQAWSQSFSTASKKALRFSKGGHGLRHSYAKWRLKILLVQLDKTKKSSDVGTVEEQALLILSQELGHFRLDIVFAYLR